MPQLNQEQNMEPEVEEKKPKTWLWVLIGVIVTAILVGWVTWIWQKTVNEAQNYALDQKVMELEKKMDKKVDGQWLAYINEKFGFKFSHPEEYRVQLAIGGKKSDEFQDITILPDEKKEGSKYEYQYNIQIRQFKNLLDQTAIEFAKNIQELNVSQDQYVEGSGQEVEFFGQPAYQFEIVDGFNEDGLLIGDEGAKKGDGGEGWITNTQHRIIYFDQGEMMYRIIYPVGDKIFSKIISTFVFFDVEDNISNPEYDLFIGCTSPGMEDRMKADKYTYAEINKCYSKDKVQVYYRPYCGQDCSYNLLDGADASSFEVIGYPYSKDKNYVYYLNKSTLIDRDTMVIYDTVGDKRYVKDKSNVYYKGKILDGVDLETFEVIEDHYFSLSKDKDNVYLNGSILDDADPETIEIMKFPDYIKDKDHVWLNGKLVEGVDPETFKP